MNCHADWPEFRGPMQNGTATSIDLPLTWGESENIRWYSNTQGLGWSSPIIHADRIYFTTAINSETDTKEDANPSGSQQLKLVCLDAKSGKELFSKGIFEQPKDSPRIHNKNSHASPTPIIVGERVFVHFGHQGTACTDLDGKSIWENRDHAYPPTHGNGGSPIVVGDKLIVTCDGGSSPSTLALELSTGKQIWKTARTANAQRPFSFCTPQWINVDGMEQIISPGSNIVQSLSPDNGEILWSVQYDGYSVIPRPVFYQGTVFISTGYDTPKLIAIDPTGKGDVTDTHVKWIAQTKSSNTPSFVCYEDQLVMTSDDGIASGIDVRTGKEVWRKRLGGNYSASPLLFGNRVYFQSESGEAVVLELGPKPVEIAKNSLPGRIFASYAVIENDLIIRTEQGVYRIGKP